MRIVIIGSMIDNKKTSPEKPADPPQTHHCRGPRRMTSSALLGAGRELIIEHEGREYRLRLTQQGKLILTA